MNAKYDLEERLLTYAVDVIHFVEAMRKSDAGRHVAGQLLRSGTAPMAHHGEAQAAESPRDFIHKLRLALKELRETKRWIATALRVPLTSKAAEGAKLSAETEELIRIFVASLRTAQKKALTQASTSSRS